jgi:4a-hydroxytetrahydrobiopterin dehydratase
MTKALTDRSALEPLLKSGWSMVDGRDALIKDFKFKNFRQAWVWMSEMALWAEKLDHHPEWSNTYNRVQVVLSTHDCDGLSEMDVALAARMDDAAS